VTASEVVAKALRRWTENKLTGDLVLEFRHGRLLRIRNGDIEFIDGPKSAHRADVPACPSCDEPMVARDEGTMWICVPCGVKRTKVQISNHMK